MWNYADFFNTWLETEKRQATALEDIAIILAKLHERIEQSN